MATTKTIQPTGQTITIPAMTDRPDASVLATDISRITDAVNAENQVLATHPTFKSFQIPANSSITLTITHRCVITAIGDNDGRNIYICRTGGGALRITELTTSSKLTASTNNTELTLTSTETTVVFLYVTIYVGDVTAA